MSKRQPDLLIEDILESGRKILAYTKAMSFEEFSSDEKPSMLLSGTSKLSVRRLTVYRKISGISTLM